MRLNGELSLEDIDPSRQSTYMQMLQPILTDLAKNEVETRDEQIKLCLLLLLTSVNERVLFSDLKPVRTLQMDDETFISELTTGLHVFLTMGRT